MSVETEEQKLQVPVFQITLDEEGDVAFDGNCSLEIAILLMELAKTKLTSHYMLGVLQRKQAKPQIVVPTLQGVR